MYHGERFNSISHLFGAIAGLIGLIFLVILAVQQGDVWKIVSFSVYGTTLFFLYFISTLYHSWRGKGKDFLRMLDYQGVYLLIAGTYTPFTLVTLNGWLGWTIFCAVWFLAIVGIILDALPAKGGRVIQLVLYLVMGWMIIVALNPLWQLLTPPGVMWLFIGGVLYTVGVVFYVLDDKVTHFHGIWHLFVLAGSVTHYFTVLHYVL
ncbi:MAG TPA: hemolysin III family protein [Marinagarivorans sp.]